ncbi:3-deoxy-manno-octulosonate cytidylyltransferase [Labilibaculum sp. A4]|uniref:3-deoxy-manno-octulosonate cytidylyltransferase n=1 Tax=Labilibaculum euxinus TaxID=2686357 RepID=UPI000F623638|nr:3-deoxy-manno-octulosonate cytidylyltransferase [Labilibaculum euxinus]MDQ1772247.1 3-deoxy-manno-octulosonate cytidylyltransferase [Labilibaculum euxinus]MWN77949.1 3-deoxy-manno-octulosonate cytidylyltransferase [Labilibaculum euxinus]
MKFLGIIPARYASTRFPGKPLADINGKPMIQKVYEQALKALDHVYVATDDKRIEEAVKSFGGKIIMTSPNHQSGTDRIAEAANIISQNLKLDFDVVINIQGDEPFIQPEQINSLKSCFNNPATEIATLIKSITNTAEIFDPNKVKVVTAKDNRALYFSRSPIPFVRGEDQDKWLSQNTFYKHIGMYAYRFDALMKVTKLEQSKLELSESLEQLRWLENGYWIQTEITEHESIGIDTPEDLLRVKEMGLL